MIRCTAEDPYIWYDKFLFSFCHGPYFYNKLNKEDIVFFFSSCKSLNKLTDHDDFYCDLVFKVSEVQNWPNCDDKTRCLKQSAEEKGSNLQKFYCFDNVKDYLRKHKAFLKGMNNDMVVENHYRWSETQHPMGKLRYRKTFVASDDRFIPLTNKSNLISLNEVTKNECGVDRKTIESMRKTNMSFSFPGRLDSANGERLLKYLKSSSFFNVRSAGLKELRETIDRKGQ